MKKHFLFLAILSAFCFNGFSATQIITVNSNFFSPTSFNILLGDTVKWIWVSGQHTTTSTTIPAGANTWNQNINSGSTTFIYVPNKVGTYNYHCSIHTSMIASFTVGCPTPIVTITNPVPILICAGATANLTSIANGGSPFTYQWQASTSGGSSWSNLNGATNSNYGAAGSSGTSVQYRVIVTNSCQNTGISQSVAVTIQTISIGITPNQSSVCPGSCLTLVAASTNGGTLAGTYSWSPSTGLNVSTGATVIACPPNGTTYTVTFVSSIGCSGSAYSYVGVLAPPILIGSASDYSICSGTTTQLNATGSGVINFSWTPATGLSNPSISNPIASPSATTIYTVVGTNQNGCTGLDTVKITVGAGIQLSQTHINTTCGNANGSIDLTVIGGSGGLLTYLWSNGATSQDLINISAGSYSVTVTSGSGCSNVLSTIITNIAGPALTVSHIDASCGNANGSIDLTVTGGTSPYSYQWTNGANTQDLSNLVAGTYIVTVTDANGCTSVNYAVIANSGTISLAETHINSSCGNPNGSINLTVTNGTAPYLFHWSNNATTEDLTGLIVGTYSVTVTSGLGCSGTLSVTITTTPAITLSQTHVNASCGNSNGSINLTVSPVGNYNYIWSNGASTEDISNLLAGTYYVTVYSTGTQCSAILSIIITNGNNGTLTETHVNASCGLANGSINLTVTPGGNYNYIWTNGATTQDISNLFAGTYIVTVSNSSGCSNSLTVTIIGSNTGITLSQSHLNASCNNPNGSINLTVSPTGIYNYFWSNGATTEDIVNLAAGTFTVTVYSTGTGCVSTLSVTITTTPSPVISAYAINANCGSNNGSIQTLVSGGTAPYYYIWNNNSTSSALTGLAPGTYSVTVYDANQCSGTTTAIVSSNPPTTPQTSIQSGTASFCSGGNAVLVVSPLGSAYQWLKNNVNISGATNSTYTASVSGTFTCTVIYPCGSSTSNGILITKLATPTATITANGATTFCAGGSVVLNVNVQSGVTFQWRKGGISISGATNSSYTATAAGNYRCLVTKTATGCTKLSNYITITVNCKVEGLTNDNSYIFYPNPFTNYLTVQLDEVSTICVYNVLGQKLLELKEVSGEIMIGDELKAGIYFLEIKVDDELILSERIVKAE